MIEHGLSPVTCTVAFAVVPGDTFSNRATPEWCKRIKSSATSRDDKPGAADVIVDCHAHAGVGPMRIAQKCERKSLSHQRRAAKVAPVLALKIETGPAGL